MVTQVNFLNLSESTANTWGRVYGKDGKLIGNYEGEKVILSSGEGAVIQHGYVKEDKVISLTRDKSCTNCDGAPEACERCRLNEVRKTVGFYI